MTTGSLSVETLVYAYSTGVFPMAEHREDARVLWIEPGKRGIIPLQSFHVSHSLRRVIRKGIFRVTSDTAFRDVMLNCADRAETWINDQILDAYCRLFDLGLAHSVECWKEDKLAGGLYGVSLGGAFFGESMFSKETNASKVALCALVERLNAGGFVLLDTQFLTAHLASFGGIEISQKEYLKLLKPALNIKASF
ncbi:MAG: leucyl/phenylalanyl-tRNA--protein transferase [Alphaproteobacteria bacterium]|nr:leucyl/phenylalanyl-tRNA--protein transferase [Alphaproteobacteria bacterium]